MGLGKRSDALDAVGSVLPGFADTLDHRLDLLHHRLLQQLRLVHDLAEPGVTVSVYRSETRYARSGRTRTGSVRALIARARCLARSPTACLSARLVVRSASGMPGCAPAGKPVPTRQSADVSVTSVGSPKLTALASSALSCVTCSLICSVSTCSATRSVSWHNRSCSPSLSMLCF